MEQLKATSICYCHKAKEEIIWEKLQKTQKATLKKRAVQKTASKLKSSYDPFGSYTGVNTFDKYEKPVQDADDL